MRVYICCSECPARCYYFNCYKRLRAFPTSINSHCARLRIWARGFCFITRKFRFTPPKIYIITKHALGVCLPGSTASYCLPNVQWANNARGGGINKWGIHSFIAAIKMNGPCRKGKTIASLADCFAAGFIPRGQLVSGFNFDQRHALWPDCPGIKSGAATLRDLCFLGSCLR